MKKCARSIVSLFLVVCVAHSAWPQSQEAVPTVNRVQDLQQQDQTAEIKSQVQKRGVGEKSRVRVRLRVGTEVKGYISKVEEDSFEITGKKSGEMTRIRYADASEVHRLGMSKTTKILIVVGIVAAWIGIATALACSSEGGPHC